MSSSSKSFYEEEQIRIAEHALAKWRSKWQLNNFPSEEVFYMLCEVKNDILRFYETDASLTAIQWAILRRIESKINHLTE